MKYNQFREDAPIEVEYKIAIHDAMEEIKKLPDGDCRAKAVDMILLKRTHTTTGTENELNYSWRTIQNWIRDFIYRVGKKVGF